MNKLLILVGIIFLICIIVGYVRGFVKIVASLASSIAIIVLVVFLSPYVSDIILKVTPIDEMAYDECLQMLMIEPSVEEEIVIPEYTREEQISLIEGSQFPEIFRQLLLENNNTEIYEALGATNFAEYVSGYLAKTLANILSFMLTLLLATIVIRTIIYMLGIISDLPVIGGLNRLAGGVMGLGTGLIVVWILFIVITFIYDTEIGMKCFENIQQSKFLTFLYENNIIMDNIMKFRV